MNEYIHRIGDTVILECIIHTNPSSDIKWFHRFSNDNNQEINLSKEYLKENQGNIWYIENKQLNKTIWKTILFIKVKIFIYFLIKYFILANSKTFI